MKVILRNEVENLGKNGDVLVVADGYGRNYLLPKGLAVKATPQNLKQLESAIKAREEQKKEELQIAKELAEKIARASVVIRAKAGDKGKLFGSVTNSEIASQLEEQHSIVVDKRKIDVKESIKQIGFYAINVKLHPEVVAELKVTVEPEEDKKAQPAAAPEAEPAKAQVEAVEEDTAAEAPEEIQEAEAEEQAEEPVVEEERE